MYRIFFASKYQIGELKAFDAQMLAVLLGIDMSGDDPLSEVSMSRDGYR